jgi:hypothetical protein
MEDRGKRMSNKESRQTFLGGAAVLAGAVAIVKLVGALYRLPVNNILSAEGKAYFNIAYNVYNVLLTISTAGCPWPSPSSPARPRPWAAPTSGARFSPPPSGSFWAWASGFRP